MGIAIQQPGTETVAIPGPTPDRDEIPMTRSCVDKNRARGEKAYAVDPRGRD
ncbi:hypothetical protein SAMN05444161_1496 [Rhizobiales bacterium GAS191]|nr:hypothetical protein SAMN05519103_00589 [Rhizobiales bacterium GAS113]SEC62370.1 hypothetical protein SAMN05444161_1496 [Rhizobiales bacterium GAS191]